MIVTPLVANVASSRSEDNADDENGGGSGIFAGAFTRTVQQPPTTREFLSTVDEAARRAEETLLVYYAGHVLVDERGSLLLSTSDTDPHRSFTATAYETVESLIAQPHWSSAR